MRASMNEWKSNKKCWHNVCIFNRARSLLCCLLASRNILFWLDLVKRTLLLSGFMRTIKAMHKVHEQFHDDHHIVHKVHGQQHSNRWPSKVRYQRRSSHCDLPQSSIAGVSEYSFWITSRPLAPSCCVVEDQPSAEAQNIFWRSLL